MDPKEQRAIGALQISYMDLLKMPHGGVRARNQHLLCALRDAIATETGISTQEVQECFETMELKVRAGCLNSYSYTEVSR